MSVWKFQSREDFKQFIDKQCERLNVDCEKIQFNITKVDNEIAVEMKEIQLK
jgi:predicted aldo/keto reductase-like oxidoreductase